ncbi:hypothetical protein HRU87_01495 [Aquiluna borgnonia]|uniref:DUF2092 domain-containing protein n=1 Tax=Aquiluna borgnonia TaxID=2499157 RepID=A0A7D4PQ76_9MICO|nr:hypothetical protein [Aquiluna borgnonia]QKJ24906.1 hypothetical protein HRU87_01495 [Aquiluna borgnonia]
MKISKRWLPAVITPAVIAATVIAVPLQANAVDLPDLTPQQVMLLMEEPITGFSGTVVKTTDLGLPALEMSSMVSEDMAQEMADKMPEGMEDFVPQVLESNLVTQAVELIAGTHKMRLYASEAGMRVQVLDPMSERDLIVSGNQFWIYDAKNATATTGEFELPTEAELDQAKAEAELKLDELSAELQLDLANPEAVADYLLAEAQKTSTISVGKDHMLAGRTAYQLIAEPKSEQSLIDSVVVSVDSETGMALDVKVYSIEQEEPAISIGFESISFETPDASLFNFTPPAGTTVQQLELPAELEELKTELEATKPTEAEIEAKKAELEAKYADVAKPELLGEGWDSVAYLPELPADLPLEMLENELFADLMTEVEGGRVFSTPVMNILLTDSGEVYAGSVKVEYLLEVAAR